MIPTLTERKADLLNQIQKLKREIDILKWLEYKDTASYHGKVSDIYLDLEGIKKNSIN